jgi:3-phenylpropionate/trans-cinnamate dioxygenase ferredoxin component
MGFHRVAGVDDLPAGEMMRVEVAGRGLCIARLPCGDFHAMDDRCTHEDESLSEGFLWEDSVECPAHGSRFCLKTGAVSGLPAEHPITIYPVKIEGGDVLVEI